MTGSVSIELALPRAVDGILAADLEKKSVSIAPGLLSLKVGADRRSVTITCASGADLDAISRKAERYLEAMVAKSRPSETRVIFDRTRAHERPKVGGVYDELRRREWLSEHGTGRIGLAGAALDVFLGLDAFLRRLYRTEFKACERSFPAMIDTNVLAQCGYFESHPDAASFITHLEGDFDTIDAFRRFSADDPSSVPAQTTLSPPRQCLCPTGCFPCYHTYRDRTLVDGNSVVTLLGRIFRYESRNMNGLDRLWEFNMREGVFLGTQDFVTDCRQRLVELFCNLAEDWDLDCRIKTASDTFFPAVHAARSFWQEVTEVKYELLLSVEPDEFGQRRDIACGSINLHGEYFGDRFGITLPGGGPASTGCCGWGLERWVLALFTQHGFAVEHWPSALRGALNI